jgi:hypothetical protein
MESRNFFLRGVVLLAVLFLFNGCAAHLTETMEKVTAEDLNKNKETALAIGQRTFDLPAKLLMKACVTAFSNKNLSVTNLDKEMGFIIAEGGNMLSPEKEKEIMTKRIDRLNKEYAFISWTYKPGNYTLRVNMNLFEKGDKRTLAKMNFSVRVQPLNTPNSIGTYEAPPNELLPVWYQQMWDEIEKSIFMQRETILN